MTAREILESYEEISIESQTGDDFFVFRLYGKTFLLITPNKDDFSSRPRIYLYNDAGFDFPHVLLYDEEVKENTLIPEGTYRSVCLYEPESIVFSVISYEDKLFDAIDRLIELLTMSKAEREKEFQKEFMYYWNCGLAGRNAIVFLCQEDNFSKFVLYSNKQDTRFVEEGIALSDINYRNKGERKWSERVDIEAYYIPVLDNRGILPPYRGRPWTTHNVKDIVYGKQIEHISFDTYQCLKTTQVSTRNMVLVFGMKGEQASITFAVMIKCNNNTRNTRRTILEKIREDAVAVEPIKTKREDYTFLSNIIGNDIGLRGKRALLIGAGSLGSYVAFEIIKNGVSNIKIYDDDILSNENLLRWAYGGLGVGRNKAEHISLLLNIMHPEIKAEGIPKSIDEKELANEVKNFDLVIVTIGNSDTQLKFNRMLNNIGCNIPVLYTWIEAGGEFSHILYVDYSKPGCYECLFTNENGEYVNNRASIAPEIVESNMIRNGCGGTRAAYGTAVLLRTTATLLTTFQKIISGELQGSTLIDITPNSVMNSLTPFPMEACSCCGH